jgi:hypothetical protein
MLAATSPLRTAALHSFRAIPALLCTFTNWLSVTLLAESGAGLRGLSIIIATLEFFHPV